MLNSTACWPAGSVGILLLTASGFLQFESKNNQSGEPPHLLTEQISDLTVVFTRVHPAEPGMYCRLQVLCAGLDVSLQAFSDLIHSILPYLCL